jgi:hypothetical protein
VFLLDVVLPFFPSFHAPPSLPDKCRYIDIYKNGYGHVKKTVKGTKKKTVFRKVLKKKEEREREREREIERGDDSACT